MRASIAIAIVAATAVSANCNPSYNVPTSTECFTGCNVQAGSSVLPGWTMDSASEKFVESLKLMCTKGTPEYSNFMTVAGSCMMTCKGENPELFVAEHAGACAWYATHKDDVCADQASTTGTAASTTAAATGATTSAPVATTGAPVAPAVSSKSVAASGTSAVVPPPATSSTPAEGAANKLQIGGLAMALAAGVSYLAL